MLVIIPLYLLKMLQGFSTGGEFAGASTYVAGSPPTSSASRASMLNMGSTSASPPELRSWH